MGSETLQVDMLDGAVMETHAAWPAGRSALPPAVVFGELFGLNDIQRLVADRVAALGYFAVAPNLLHRREPHAPLAETADGRDRALQIAGDLSRLEVVSDARDALAAARAEVAADPIAPAIALGVSFGGHAALVTAAMLGLQRCVALYAGWLAGTEIGLSRPQPTARTSTSSPNWESATGSSPKADPATTRAPQPTRGNVSARSYRADVTVRPKRSTS